MTDLIDHASELEARQRQAALERTLARAQPPKGQGTGPCQDCGQPIPEARRQALPHSQRCVDCQQHQEQLAHPGQRRAHER